MLSLRVSSKNRASEHARRALFGGVKARHSRGFQKPFICALLRGEHGGGGAELLAQAEGEAGVEREGAALRATRLSLRDE